MLWQCALYQCWNIGGRIADRGQTIWHTDLLHEHDQAVGQYLACVGIIGARYIGAQYRGCTKVSLGARGGCETKSSGGVENYRHAARHDRMVYVVRCRAEFPDKTRDRI